MNLRRLLGIGGGKERPLEEPTRVGEDAFTAVAP